MNPAFHQHASDIFNRLRRLSPDERDAALRELGSLDAGVVAEVRSLLAFHDAAPPDDPAASIGPGPSRREPELPAAVGPYKVVRLLGAGGMGEVYLAEQAEPRRQVAVKVLRRGVHSDRLLARFWLERQALALINHPGIAHLYDSGITDAGLPYVVMEYVPGVPITEFRPGVSDSVDARIELMIQVCSAVHAGHQRGIIHRDLKPGNVLVFTHNGAPVCKVIDFGIAKALGEQEDMPTRITMAGQIVGTPAYMSPEQFDSPHAVDIRSDVYSLGVLLYEVLTGELPYRAAGAREADAIDLFRLARGATPVRPSERVRTPSPNTGVRAAAPTPMARRSLARRLEGDLDWIVLRCLEKDPAHRYASAAELGADLVRHLRHEPVTVGPPTLGYHARKLIKRHPIPAASMALAAVLIFTATVTTWVLYRRALAAEAQTGRSLYRSERAFGFLRRTYDTLGRDYSRDPIVTIRDTLRLSRLRLDEDLKGEPTIRAEVRLMLARAFQDQRMFAAAEEQLVRSKQDLDGLEETAEVRRVRIMARTALARLQTDRARAAEGQREIALALDELRLLRPRDPELLADARLTEAYCLAPVAPDEAEHRYRAIVAEHAPTTASPAGSSSDAAARFAEASAGLADLVGRDPARRDEAVRLWQSASSVASRDLQLMDPRRFEITLRHAESLVKWNDHQPAASMLREACEQIEAKGAKAWHPSFRSLAFLYERVLLETGQIEAAKGHARRRADGRAVPAYQDLTLTAMMVLRDAKLAGELAAAAMEEHRKEVPGATQPPPILAAAIAWCHTREGRCDEARDLIRRIDVMTQGEGGQPGGFRRGFLPIMIEFARACNRPELEAKWKQEMAALDASRASE